MSARLDMEYLGQWVGRRDSAGDVITPRLVREYEATFSPHHFSSGEGAPLGIHWCLSPVAVPLEETGPDGHPARGGFMPPVPLQRRMWAGGEVTFLSPLKENDAVTRHSRISGVVFKEGRAGPMVFVTVMHQYETGRGTAIRERQDVVYLDPPTGRPPDAPANAAGNDGEHAPGQHVAEVDMSPVLLFRYSAITFNCHRIHYDQDYTRQVEGYPDLVVHGPLQASLLLQFGARLMAARGGEVRRFSYRARRPLFVNEPLRLHADETETGLALWTCGASPAPAMTAQMVMGR